MGADIDVRDPVQIAVDDAIVAAAIGAGARIGIGCGRRGRRSERAVPRGFARRLALIGASASSDSETSR